MAVIDHPVHDKVKQKADAQYGCKNRTHADGYWAPDRRYFPDGRFETTCVWIPNVMSRDCRFDLSMNDPLCRTCEHKGSGEEYALGVLLKTL